MSTLRTVGPWYALHERACSSVTQSNSLEMDCVSADLPDVTFRLYL